jgi:hypothetical protein
MNPFGLFGWDHRVRKLRKRYDRTREHALKKHGPLKSRLLQRLDAINSNLTTMEETQLGRIDRARIAKSVEIDLEEVREALKIREGEAGVERQQAAR